MEWLPTARWGNCKVGQLHGQYVFTYRSPPPPNLGMYMYLYIVIVPLTSHVPPSARAMYRNTWIDRI